MERCAHTDKWHSGKMLPKGRVGALLSVNNPPREGGSDFTMPISGFSGYG
jgi:hypothetical protein